MESLDQEGEKQKQYCQVKEEKGKVRNQLQNYLKQQLKFYQQDQKNQKSDYRSIIQQQEYLIPLKCSGILFDQKGQQDILEVVFNFIKPDTNFNKHSLSNQPRNLLIFGDSGSGKSTLAKKIFYQLLEEARVIPFLFKFCDSQEDNLIQKRLKKFNAEIKQKEDSEVILILDGYDELQKQRNIVEDIFCIYPQIKVITTSRYQQIIQKDNYKFLFMPRINNQYQENYLKIVYIQPFDQSMILQYFEKVLERDTALANQLNITSAQECMQIIKKNNNLLELIKNPFILSQVTQLLTKIKAQQEKLDAKYSQEKMKFNQEINLQTEHISNQSSLSLENKYKMDKNQWSYFLVYNSFIHEMFKIQKEHLQAFIDNQEEQSQEEQEENQSIYLTNEEFEKRYISELYLICKQLCLDLITQSKETSGAFTRQQIKGIIKQKSFSKQQIKAIKRGLPFQIKNIDQEKKNLQN